MAARRQRLDLALVERGLVSDTCAVADLLSSRRVTVNGAFPDGPQRLVAASDSLEVLAPSAAFVGRGGDKLAAALDQFGVSVEGRYALDAGSSTGGFVDCLLQRGVNKVVAVDTGTGQLDPKLRSDPRVDVRERTDVRNLRVSDLEDSLEFVSLDLSFISVLRVIPVVQSLLSKDGEVVVLVKPQFECSRDEANRGGGIIRDHHVWSRVLADTVAGMEQTGLTAYAVMASPLFGRAGNIEFLVGLRPTHRIGGIPSGRMEEQIRSAVSEARIASPIGLLDG